jgi:hypothetical protein
MWQDDLDYFKPAEDNVHWGIFLSSENIGAFSDQLSIHHIKK